MISLLHAVSQDGVHVGDRAPQVRHDNPQSHQPRQTQTLGKSLGWIWPGSLVLTYRLHTEAIARDVSTPATILMEEVAELHGLYLAMIKVSIIVETAALSLVPRPERGLGTRLSCTLHFR